jgi:hypothetical protein
MPRLLVVMVLTLLVAAPAAQAGITGDIIRDCERDGRLDGNYTASQIREARNNIPADIDQYSDCRDVLSRALGGTGDKQVGGAGGGGPLGGGPSGASGGSGELLVPAGPEEQRALAEAAKTGGSTPVQVGDRTIVPGAAGFAANAARNAIPVTLLAVLILLGLAAIAAAAPYARRRVLARRLT